MKLSKCVRQIIEESGDVFKIQVHLDEFNERNDGEATAIAKAAVRAVMVSPADVYPCFSKGAKHRVETKLLLLRLYAQGLVHAKSELQPKDIETIPLPLAKMPKQWPVFRRLFRHTPKVFRELHPDYKYYLNNLAAKVEPTNLWYASRFNEELCRSNRKALQEHEVQIAHTVRDVACYVAEAVLPFEKAVRIYCSVKLYLQTDRLRFINKGLDPQDRLTEVREQEAVDRYQWRKKQALLLLGLKDRLNTDTLKMIMLMD